MKKLPIYSLLFAVITLLITGCVQNTSVNQTQQIKKPLSETELTPEILKRQGTAARYYQNALISVGNQLYFNKNHKINIDSEYFDQRGSLFASLDADNRLLIGDTTTEALHFSEPLPYILETLCLFQRHESLQVFLLDEKQTAHQMLVRVKDDEKNLLTLDKIRQFPVPPATEFCHVDDNSERLFVSEENIGVWAYNARAESEISRTPVTLVSPYGSLVKNPGPLAISNNFLWVAEVDGSYVHQIDLNDFNQQQAYRVPESIVFETLTASADGNHNRLVWFDEHSETLQTVSIQAEKSSLALTETPEVPATAETQPVTTNGDAADDPAIWINRKQPEDSRILATNKKLGLLIYDLQGNRLQTLLSGRVNNVDIRQGFTFKRQTADIATASHRDHNSIALYHVNPDNGVTTSAGEIATTLDEVYGLCMGRGTDNEVFVFINDQDGRFEQHQVIDSDNGWHGKLVRKFAVKTQPEGCVSDDQHQRLFIGEENTGIWTLDLSKPNSKLTLIQPLDDDNSNYLHADIEGMDIYHGNKHSYLVVSSQGNDSYVLFDSKPPFAYRAHFRIGMNTHVTPAIDGASETDGLTVTSVNLGKQYPEGLLVVQDGRNLMPEEYQNFKLISWKDISTALSLR